MRSQICPASMLHAGRPRLTDLNQNVDHVETRNAALQQKSDALQSSLDQGGC